MYPFPQAVAPAVRTHVDAQTAYLNDISKSIFRSFQHMFDLNIQLMQTMLEEGTLAGKQVLSADRQTDMLGAAASRVQPASDKLRAYQQHITRLAADAQVELARVTEQHVQNTTRTARALADEVARDATEQTERGLRTQQETARQFSDPFMRADGAAQQSQQQQRTGGNSGINSGINSGSTGGADGAGQQYAGADSAHGGQQFNQPGGQQQPGQPRSSSTQH
jgi:phasin family protein